MAILTWPLRVAIWTACAGVFMVLALPYALLLKACGAALGVMSLCDPHGAFAEAIGLGQDVYDDVPMRRRR